MRAEPAARTMAAMLPISPTEVPVLVVGAGPAGLATALELARHDIPFLLVERRSELSSHPRATVVSLRAMELIRAWGVEDDVLSASVAVEPTMLETETLATASAGTAIAVGYPTAAQSRMVSPVAPACVAQDELEPLLLAAVPEDRVALAGPDALMEGETTVFRAPLWDVIGTRRHLLYWVTQPDAMSLFLPAGRDDRWLVGFAGRADGEVAELIRRAAGAPRLPVEIERSGRFSSTAQIAVRWRRDAVLLAGDAAHRVTPRGGTGLNLALQDGHDLGWRLAWVLRGWAGDELLDGYEAERRPVAEHRAARSADPNGSRVAAELEVPLDVGGRIAHVWEDGRSTLDLLAPGLTLFTAHAEQPWDETAPRGSAPVTVRRVAPVTARALGAPAGGALLARSDGTPVAVLERPGSEVVDAREAALAA
jgi:2-polyprenyl-6-methoxyphenol hydroxylase-like FAD-dependent oxidoreductase